MPSPSKAALFTGLLTTSMIFIAGAYAASYLAEPVTDTQRDFPYHAYMPSLAPGGNDGTMDVFEGQLESPSRTAATHTHQHTRLRNEPDDDTPNVAAPAASQKTHVNVASSALTVSISHVQQTPGQVHVLVFDNEEAYKTYDYTQAVGYTSFDASDAPYKAAFPDLNKGPYAIVMFHDEDGNQDLTLDEHGYPVEGYGVSNATNQYDDLNFTQALVKATDIEMKMFYLQ